MLGNPHSTPIMTDARRRRRRFHAIRCVAIAWCVGRRENGGKAAKSARISAMTGESSAATSAAAEFEHDLVALHRAFALARQGVAFGGRRPESRDFANAGKSPHDRRVMRVVVIEPSLEVRRGSWIFDQKRAEPRAGRQPRDGIGHGEAPADHPLPSDGRAGQARQAAAAHDFGQRSLGRKRRVQIVRRIEIQLQHERRTTPVPGEGMLALDRNRRKRQSASQTAQTRGGARQPLEVRLGQFGDGVAPGDEQGRKDVRFAHACPQPRT